MLPFGVLNTIEIRGGYGLKFLDLSKPTRILNGSSLNALPFADPLLHKCRKLLQCAVSPNCATS